LEANFVITLCCRIFFRVSSIDTYEGLAKYDGVEDALRIEGVFVHLYGKKYTKPFRKMGHVCIVNDDRELAIKNARLVQEILKVKA